MKFLLKISSILFFLFVIIVFASGCKKQADGIKSNFASKEEKLINGRWDIDNAVKNGASFSTPSCNTVLPYNKGIDVYFDVYGQISISCATLSPLQKSCSGTWELTDHKKSIELFLTDSIDHSQINWPLVPIAPPVTIKWEILSLRKNVLKIKETRGKDVYEFDFNNVE